MRWTTQEPMRPGPGTLVAGLVVILVTSSGLGCATNDPSAQRVHVVHEPEQAAEVGGIPPDKEAEVQLLLQQRSPSTLKCYSDVLTEKHDRAFKGSVAVVVALEPNGQASDVKIINTTLNDKEVEDCLVSKIKEFEFPQLEHRGSVQYVYHFEPAY